VSTTVDTVRCRSLPPSYGWERERLHDGKIVPTLSCRYRGALDNSGRLTESGRVGAERSGRRKLIPRLLPVTRLGWWSVGLLAAAAMLFAASNGLVAAGQEGPGVNLWLLMTIAPAGLSAVLAGVTAAFAIFRRRERALAAFFVMLVGLLVAWFALGVVVSGD
jgi:hypothetical protein